MDTLEHIWAVLFQCYNLILKDNGGNQYKLPHNGARLRGRLGQEIVCREIDVEAYNAQFYNYN